MDVLTAKVVRTSYEATDNRTFVVSFLTDYGETVKWWLRLGTPEFEEFWGSRTPRDTPGTALEAEDIANRGGILPTAEIKYTRGGKWPKVVSTTVGKFSDKIREFYENAIEVFGDCEVIKVIS